MWINAQKYKLALSEEYFCQKKVHLLSKIERLLLNMNFTENIALVIVIIYYNTNNKQSHECKQLFPSFLGCRTSISLLASMVATLWLSNKYIRSIINICLCMTRFLSLVPVSPQLLTICLENFVFRSLNNMSSLAGANWCFNMSCIFVWYASKDVLDNDAEHTNKTPLIYIISLCLNEQQHSLPVYHQQ